MTEKDVREVLSRIRNDEVAAIPEVIRSTAAKAFSRDNLKDVQQFAQQLGSVVEM